MSKTGRASSQSSKLTNVDPETFSKAMGQAVWLLTMSEEHKELPIREIERIVSTPVFLGQFKIYSKGKSPIAFLSWASVSDDVKARLDSGEKSLGLKDWRSGDNLVVVECISPFNASIDFVKAFLEAI